MKMRTESSSDETLMARVQHGDARAMAVLYRRYSGPLLAFYCRMLNGERELAEDMLQDTFLRLIDRAGLFIQGRKFSTWLYCMAYNLCKNEYRRRRVRSPNAVKAHQSGDSPSTENTFDEVSHRLLSDAVFQELDKLDEDKKALFLLRNHQDLSIREIADITGLAEGTVKSRLFHISRILAVRLSRFQPKPKE
jgi:RNA polymerase sigma-70 factor, ECF subfamily